MDPAFIDGVAGPLFSLYFPPHQKTGAGHGALVFVPPFGEELNRSRHMIVKTARALSSAGWGLLLLDLYGTGDSAGDFSDARWTIWLDDIRRGADHLRSRGHAEVGLWAMRTGCLLAADALADGSYAPLLFWQPVLNGKTFLNQFIRVGLAASLTGGSGTTGKELREQLASGRPVEIAGYMLHPELAKSLEAASLATRETWDAPLVCIEVGTAEPVLTPPLQKAVAAWRDAGAQVDSRAVAGPQFWMLQEPEWADKLIAETLHALEAPR